METSTSSDYGIRMDQALRAVLQMHADSSKLLLDLDSQLREYISLFAGIATANLSYDIKTRRYMAEGLFRHYVRSKSDTTVIAVNILYFDDARKPAFAEPQFVVANLNYLSTGSDNDRQYRFWHPWTALVDWSKGEALGKLVKMTGVGKSGEVQQVAVKSVPLFSIDRIESALEVLYEVAPEARSS